MLPNHFNSGDYPEMKLAYKKEDEFEEGTFNIPVIFQRKDGLVTGVKITFMIRHSVIFKLKVPKNSVEEKDFLAAAAKLATIPGVQNFESLKQTSKKNKFDYGLSMEFASQQLYDAYSSHPDHVQFIQQYWLKYVEDFLEIDYELLN